MGLIRTPRFGGSFYPRDGRDLHSQLEIYFQQTSSAHRRQAKVLMVPHAGYIYSGEIAARAYSEIAIPDRVIVLGPNHTGYGATIAIDDGEAWRTPIGDVPIDVEVAAELVKMGAAARFDHEAHADEHSLEVQLPFLLHCNPNVRIVPITLKALEPTALDRFAECLAKTIQSTEGEVLIVASSDMNHFAPRAENWRKDKLALEPLLELDADQLVRIVHQHRISMCGVYAVAIAIKAARLLGATTAELLEHRDSGDINGDHDRVVGYASVVIE